MKKKDSTLTVLFCLFGLLSVIFDNETAITAARDGIGMCIRVVVPTLFPFIVLTAPLTQYLQGRHISSLLSRILRVPDGSEGILLMGMVSGYPMGARAVAEGYRGGSLTYEESRRMLMFSSFAGPSFLFGMVSTLFPRKSTVWILWGVHLVTGMLIAMLFPVKNHRTATVSLQKTNLSMFSGVKTMGIICGWVVLFKILLSFCARWFLWLFPIPMQTVFCGILELTNGILLLKGIPSLGCRFVLCCGLLGFGGICIAMQTSSVVGDLGIKTYLTGKILHGFLGFLIGYPLQFFLFTPENRWVIPGAAVCLPVIIGATIIFYRVFTKKSGYSARVPV